VAKLGRDKSTPRTLEPKGSADNQTANAWHKDTERGSEGERRDGSTGPSPVKNGADGMLINSNDDTFNMDSAMLMVNS